VGSRGAGLPALRRLPDQDQPADSGLRRGVAAPAIGCLGSAANTISTAMTDSDLDVRPSPSGKAAHQRLSAEAQRRRTFAVISHPDAGKSTLTEALVLHARVITEAGAIHGKAGRRATVSDWMEMEQAPRHLHHLDRTAVPLPLTRRAGLRHQPARPPPGTPTSPRTPTGCSVRWTAR